MTAATIPPAAPPPPGDPVKDQPLSAVPVLSPAPANIEDRAWEELDDDGSGSEVVGAEKGYRYTWLRPADYPPNGVQIQHERQKLVNRGWEPCSGPAYRGATPRREYVANRPELEIWRVTQKRFDNEWLVDMARSVLDRRYASRHFAHCEKGGQKSGMPQALAEAMYAYHGLMAIPGRPVPPTQAQIIAMVRRMPVHPGAERRSESWD